MEGAWFSRCTCEKDLGIVIDYQPNMNQQCDVPAKIKKEQMQF